MSYSDYTKEFKQLKAKPIKLEKYKNIIHQKKEAAV